MFDAVAELDKVREEIDCLRASAQELKGRKDALTERRDELAREIKRAARAESDQQLRARISRRRDLEEEIEAVDVRLGALDSLLMEAQDTERLRCFQVDAARFDDLVGGLDAAGVAMVDAACAYLDTALAYHQAVRAGRALHGRLRDTAASIGVEFAPLGGVREVALPVKLDDAAALGFDGEKLRAMIARRKGLLASDLMSYANRGRPAQWKPTYDDENTTRKKYGLGV